ncbi:MAG: hypothetical protein ACKO7B_15435, partial [Flavobacteriales bacterium]
MSALASAGFEAINREMQTEDDYRISDFYMDNRLSYLKMARKLQHLPGEVVHLEDHILLLEARKAFKNDSNLPNNLVRDLASLKFRFPASAVYYFWMAKFGIDVNTSRQYLTEDDYMANYAGLLDSCAAYAPDWSLIKLLKFYLMSPENYTVDLGNQISNWVQLDSSSLPFRLMQTLYYLRHKPYNLEKYQQSMVKWCETAPCFEGFSIFLNLLNNQYRVNTKDTRDIQSWLYSEAIRNQPTVRISEKDVENCLAVLHQLVRKPIPSDLELSADIRPPLITFFEIRKQPSE